METVKPLPPWHGYWYLVSATQRRARAGRRDARGRDPARTGNDALAVEEDGNVDAIKVTVYCGHHHVGDSKCDDDCTSDWTAVLTSAMPRLGAGVNQALVGVVRRADGDFQVTYDESATVSLRPRGDPARRERPFGHDGHVGNGVEERGPTGVMSLVALQVTGRTQRD